MALYRQVYGWDPSYANVQGFHNALARQHADALIGSVLSYVDPSLVSTESGASYGLGASSWLSLAGGLKLRETRRYVERSFETDDGFGGTISVIEAPSTQSWKDFYLLAATRSPGSAFGLELELGLLAEDKRGLSPYEAGTSGPFSAFDGVSFLPRAALRTRFGSEGASLLLNLLAAPMEEGFIPGRPDLYRASGELSFTLPFGDFSYARSYGRADAIAVDLNLTDLRFVATGLQELAFGFHLDDAPWTNLMVSVEGSLEHAFRRESWLYYAPNLALNLKGAVHYLTWIGLTRSNVLGLSLRLAGGMYSEAGVAYPLFQADAKAEWTRRDSVLYIRGFGSHTFPPSGQAYWNVGFELGASVKVPDLIAP